MNSLSFADANENDIPIVEEILTDATGHKLKQGDTVWGTEGWTDEEVRGAMAESEVYLIRQGDQLVGTVSLQWEDKRNWGEQPPIAGYLHRLAVKDGFHGQGLGEQVISWASTIAAERGRQLLRLDCEDSNVKLCEYYENQGFIKVGTRPVPEYGEYVAALFERSVETK